MPIYDIDIPGRGSFTVESPTPLTDAQVYAAVQGQLRNAPAVDTTGFKAAAAASVERAKGSFDLFRGKTGLMPLAAAEQSAKEHEAAAQARFTPTEAGWSESPWQKVKEVAGGSLPYTAVPVVAGLAGLALPATAAGAAIGAGLTGLTALGTAATYTGQSLGTQMGTGKTLEETDLLPAAAAGIGSAILDRVGLRMIPGIGKIFGAAGKELTEAEARALANQSLKQAAWDYTKATGKAMPAEGLTEVAQDVLDRMQAGLSLTDPQARSQYFDSFMGGAALTAGMAPVGRAVERAGIKGDVAKRDAEAARAEREAAQAAQLAQEQAQPAAPAAPAAPSGYGELRQEYERLNAIPNKQKTPEIRRQIANLTSKMQAQTVAEVTQARAERAQKATQEKAEAAYLATSPLTQTEPTQVEMREALPPAELPPQLDLFGKPVQPLAPEAPAEAADVFPPEVPAQQVPPEQMRLGIGDTYGEMARERERLRALPAEQVTPEITQRIADLKNQMGAMDVAEVTQARAERAQKAAQEKADARYAAKSALAQAEPTQMEMRGAMAPETLPVQMDLFGKPVQPLAPEAPAETAQPTAKELKAAGQMALELPKPGEPKLVSKKPLTIAQLPTVVSSDVLGSVGIGPTSVLRKAGHPLQGLDIANPRDAAEVKTALTAVMERPGSSEGQRAKISEYLARPEFQATEQGAPNVQPTTAQTTATEQAPGLRGNQPSVELPSEPARADQQRAVGELPPAAQEPAQAVGRGLVPAEQPAGGNITAAGVQPVAVTPAPVAPAPARAEAPKSLKAQTAAIQKELQMHIDNPQAPVQVKRQAAAQLDALTNPAMNETKADKQANVATAQKYLDDLKAKPGRFQAGEGAVPTERQVSAEVAAELQDGNIASALDLISNKAETQMAQVLAGRLKTLLGKTQVQIVDDLRDPEGLPARGACSTDGLTIWLDRNRGMGEETVLHEAVHAATERVLATKPSLLTEQQRSAVNELTRLWNAAKADPNIDLSPEARSERSEFVTEAMTKRELQKQLAGRRWTIGNAWDGFKTIVLKMLGINKPESMLDATIASMDTIFSRPQEIAPGTLESDAGRVMQTVSKSTDPNQAILDAMRPEHRTAMQTFLDAAMPSKNGLNGNIVDDVTANITKARTRLVDKAATVEERLSEGFNGGVRDAMGNVTKMLQYRQAQQSGNLLSQFFKQGSLLQDKVTGLWRVVKDANVPAPAEVFDLVKQWGESTGRTFEQAKHDAGRYLEAVRLHGLREANAKGANFPLHMDDATIDKFYATYKADPVLQEMNALMDKPRFEAINNMVKVGRITPEVGEAYKEAVGYVPFNRVEEFVQSLQASNARAGQGLAQLGKLPKLVGSEERAVSNVFDNYIGTMGWMVNQTVKNDAVVSTLRALEKIGQAQYLGSVPGVVRNPERTVHTYIKGKDAYFELPSAYDVAAFNDRVTPLPGVVKMLGQFSRVLRTAITAIPTFSVKQVAEDVQRAAIYSGVKDVPQLTKMALANFAALSKSELKGVEHPIAKEMGELGISGGVDWSASDPASSLLKDMGYEKRTPFGTLLHKLNGIAHASDLAVRKAIYDQTMIETKDEALALHRAREIINFSRKGAGGPSGWLDIMIQTVPFFNSYLQGTDVLYRSLTGKNAVSGVERQRALKMFYSRAAMLSGMATIYALGMGGSDDDYDNMDLNKRDSSWVLGNGLTIPVPSELGMIFKAIPERVMEYMRRSGTPQEQAAAEATRSWAQAAFQAYAGRVTPIPQAVKPVLEVLTNHSFMTGKQLEGAYQATIDPSRRVTGGTTELAKTIAAFTRDTIGAEVSPISIDTFLNGYFGTTSAITTAVADSLINPDKTDRPWNKMVGLAAFTYNPVGTRNISEFYDLREKVMSAKSTLNDLAKSDYAAAQEYYDAHQNELRVYDAVNSTLQQLQKTREYKKYLDSAEAAKQYDSAERLRMKQEVQKQEQMLVDWVREAKAQLSL